MSTELETHLYNLQDGLDQTFDKRSWLSSNNESPTYVAFRAAGLLLVAYLLNAGMKDGKIGKLAASISRAYITVVVMSLSILIVGLSTIYLVDMLAANPKSYTDHGTNAYLTAYTAT